MEAVAFAGYAQCTGGVSGCRVNNNQPFIVGM